MTLRYDSAKRAYFLTKKCGHTTRVNTNSYRTVKRCNTCASERHKRIFSDHAVTRYVSDILLGAKSGGILSQRTRNGISLALSNFIEYCKVKTPTELLELHQKTKKKHHITDMLKSFATQNPKSITYKTQSQFIRGFFRSNHERLEVRILSHTIDYTPPPSESRLVHIYSKATLEQKCLMSLQADTGERIGAISQTARTHLPDLDQTQELHVILFDSSRTKNHKDHVSYYSEPTAQLIRQVLSKHKITDSKQAIFPNGPNVWKRITDYAASIGTRFRSHHLRKRFQHIAERTAMPTPSINYLMGETKKELHCAEVYSYTIEDELAEEYRKFLLPSLAIANSNRKQPPHLIQDSDSNKENTELREMLKEANKTIRTLRTVIDSLPSKLSLNSPSSHT